MSIDEFFIVRGIGNERQVESHPGLANPLGGVAGRHGDHSNLGTPGGGMFSSVDSASDAPCRSTAGMPRGGDSG